MEDISLHRVGTSGPKPQALLWDLDGTLVESEPVHDRSFEAAAAEIGLAVPDDFHTRLLGVSDDAVHAALVAEAGLTLPLLDWRALKWKHYQQIAAGMQPLEGIPALLAALQQAGVPMALVSNSTRNEVDLNLAVTGLAGFFAFTICRADVPRGKPAPDGYLAAAARLGLTASACVVVEDSPTGASAGRAAGMTTLFHPQLPGLAAPEGAIVLGPGHDLAGALQRLGFLPGGETAAMAAAGA